MKTVALKEALDDMVYMATELIADSYIQMDEECDFTDTEEFCSRHCASCGCIKRKLDNAKAALAGVK